MASIPEDFNKPLQNICEFLNALHIYADEARQGKTRHIESNHYCSQVSQDLRQCLIYDSVSPTAKLIGIEYMIPKERYLQLKPEEQKLWHSHEFEVKSGMLVMPKPSGKSADEWDDFETQQMEAVVGLYGKTFHFWQVDDPDQRDIPLGMPVLMGSITEPDQLPLDTALAGRNQKFGVDHGKKAKQRSHIQGPGVHENADSWWKEAAKG